MENQIQLNSEHRLINKIGEILTCIFYKKI